MSRAKANGIPRIIKASEEEERDRRPHAKGRGLLRSVVANHHAEHERARAGHWREKSQIKAKREVNVREELYVKRFHYAWLKLDITHKSKVSYLQPADIEWPTGNGEKLSCSQACCLAQLCLAAA